MGSLISTEINMGSSVDKDVLMKHVSMKRKQNRKRSFTYEVKYIGLK